MIARRPASRIGGVVLLLRPVQKIKQVDSKSKKAVARNDEKENVFTSATPARA